VPGLGIGLGISVVGGVGGVVGGGGGGNGGSTGDITGAGNGEAVGLVPVPVPRRNSLGDLKIPARISQAQVSLRRDLGLVREFAGCVEGVYLRFFIFLFLL
jgi:hypothetical protein